MPSLLVSSAPLALAALGFLAWSEAATSPPVEPTRVYATNPDKASTRGDSEQNQAPLPVADDTTGNVSSTGSDDLGTTTNTAFTDSTADLTSSAPDFVATSTTGDNFSSKNGQAWQPRPAAADDRNPVLFAILKNGLRVFVARDDSLPVAAIVLSVPSGERDDPSNLPGLIHALAYQMQMGNRELSPGAALDAVYESGGYAEMSVAAGSTRFESLVPLWSLSAILAVESVRFATPSIDHAQWLKALQYASRDQRPDDAPDRNMRALAWSDPGLDHDGRVVTPELAKIPLPAVVKYIDQNFRYASATLSIVAPGRPEDNLKTTLQHFESSPPQARAVLDRRQPATSPQLRRAERDKTRNDTLVFAVTPQPPDRSAARLLCEHLNHRVAVSKAPTLAPIRCWFRDSATHPYLQIRIAAKHDPEAVLRERLARISAGVEDRSLASQRARVHARIAQQFSSALPLARRLAGLPEFSPLSFPDAPSPTGQKLARASLLGLESLDQTIDIAKLRLEPAMQALLDVRRYVYLIRPQGDASEAE